MTAKHGMFLLVSVFLVGTAWAAKNEIQDRRVQLKEAVAYAAKARAESEFPIVMNDLVFKELNRFVGTPEGRQFMAQGLARMETYREMVQGQIQQYHVPLELMAIPLIESGYQNRPQGTNKNWGAGLWMFIESTARAYGLHVSAQVDERMTPHLETDAAMRYLSANHLRFKDWSLAVLAYNMGENAVQKAITETGSREAWTLVRAGYEGDQAYLPKVIAAMILLKNPELLK